MTNENAQFITEAKANIAKHEANILAAIDTGNYATAEKLGGYRDGLVAAIARRAAE